MKRLLVIDDHPIIRRAVRGLLAEHLPHVQMHEAADGKEGLTRALAETWDAVVLDLSLPAKIGANVLEEIHAANPSLPVLIFTVHPAEKYAVRTMRSGASGYLTKDAPESEVIRAIERLLAGEKYITPEIADSLNAIVEGIVTDPLGHLSDREIQVLYYLGHGKSTKDIASRLELSAKTVGTYRSRLLEKLKLKTSADLVRFAIESGLVERDAMS